MRRHSDLSIRQLQRITESTRVPCPPRQTKRGCGARVGERCVSLATGRPLSGLGAHVDRLLDALAAPAPDDSTSSPRPADRPGGVLVDA